MSEEQRDWAKNKTEGIELSEMVNGAMDGRKWVVECLPQLMFEENFARFWPGVRGKNIRGIEKAVDQCTLCTKGNGQALKFIQGPAYKPWGGRN
jgi:hypothetical protein